MRWAKTGPFLGHLWAKKQNAHIKWAFISSLERFQPDHLGVVAQLLLKLENEVFDIV